MSMVTRCSRKRYLTSGFFLAAALGPVLVALANDQGPQAGGKDASFIKEAAQEGQAEVKLGSLAAERGEHSQIKQLGQLLARDHSKANQELMPLAAKCGVTLPTELSSKQASEARDLQAKSGADFDRAFAAQVIKDHEAEIDDYQKALQETRDADVKVFIEKSLPALREHLQVARSAGTAVGVDEKLLATADRYFLNEAAQTSGTVDRNQVQRVRDTGTAPGSQTGVAIGGGVPAAPEDRLLPRDLRHPDYNRLPVTVQNTIKAEGDPRNIRSIGLASHKGQTIYIVKTERDGRRVTLHIAEDGTLQKGSWFERLLGR